jgi:TRAP-type mannitol/chloroaromatic compound transport system permease small subunit
MIRAPQTFADGLDRLSITVGRITSWLTLVMVLVTLAIVVLRYAFTSGPIWLQESLTWMHAIVFMFGAAYTLQQEEHVRVDVFYRGMSERLRAWVNLLGVVLFVFPLCGFLIVESLAYVDRAWSIREVSRDAGGLPFPAVPLLKSILLLMPLLVGLQGLALLLRSIQIIRRR